MLDHSIVSSRYQKTKQIGYICYQVSIQQSADRTTARCSILMHIPAARVALWYMLTSNDIHGGIPIGKAGCSTNIDGLAEHDRTSSAASREILWLINARSTSRRKRHHKRVSSTFGTTAPERLCCICLQQYCTFPLTVGCLFYFIC